MQYSSANGRRTMVRLGKTPGNISRKRETRLWQRAKKATLLGCQCIRISGMFQCNDLVAFPQTQPIVTDRPNIVSNINHFNACRMPGLLWQWERLQKIKENFEADSNGCRMYFTVVFREPESWFWSNIFYFDLVRKEDERHIPDDLSKRTDYALSQMTNNPDPQSRILLWNKCDFWTDPAFPNCARKQYKPDGFQVCLFLSFFSVLITSRVSVLVYPCLL